MAGASLVLLLAGCLFAVAAMLARHAVDYRLVGTDAGVDVDVSDIEERQGLMGVQGGLALN